MTKRASIAIILAILSFPTFSDTMQWETIPIPKSFFEDRVPAWVEEFHNTFRTLLSESTVSRHTVALLLESMGDFPWLPDPAEAAAAFFEILERADFALKRGVSANRVLVELRALLDLAAQNRYSLAYSALIREKRRARGGGTIPGTKGALDPLKWRKNERGLMK